MQKTQKFRADRIITCASDNILASERKKVNLVKLQAQLFHIAELYVNFFT